VARVIKEADEALLLAKKLGRDRVEHPGGGERPPGPERRQDRQAARQGLRVRAIAPRIIGICHGCMF
jgi:hypothetical protein